MPLTPKEIKMLRRQQQMRNQPPKEPTTEKEILDQIHDLEYRRITLPHIHHPRLPIVEENITKEITRLYVKLEDLKKVKVQEQKSNESVPSS
jgi:hypothetical protein